MMRLVLALSLPVVAMAMPCVSPNNVFHVKVNLFAGELGYYEFEECEGPNPTIGMEIGQTYTFMQTDVSNYYHPMGFAYKADGAHADEPELEPGVSVPEDAPCTLDLSCPAPMYYIDGLYLGKYSNLPERKLTKTSRKGTRRVASKGGTTPATVPPSKGGTSPSKGTAEKESKKKSKKSKKASSIRSKGKGVEEPEMEEPDVEEPDMEHPDTGHSGMGSGDFGLDAYEPLFFHPIGEWVGAEFSIKLTFDDESYTEDIFYFCHIHQYMSGRIKLLKHGEPVNADNTPDLGYTYDEPGAFDAECGSFGLDDYKLPVALCPEKFVCGTEDVSPELKTFSDCIDAVNCFMFKGMTTGIASESEIALFAHQMIPHHQNAVNMAKTLLHSGKVPCDDLTNDADPLCVMNAISRDIINGQNFQIQQMRAVLEQLNYPPMDNCDVTYS